MTDSLLFWVIGAAATGLLFPSLGRSLTGWVPLVLALMIGGLGASVPLENLLGKGSRLRRSLLVIVIQFGLLSPVAYSLSQWLAAPEYAAGVLLLGLVPAEITSALVTRLAGGSLPLALNIVGLSVLAAPASITGGLLLYAGDTRVPGPAMFIQLLLTVLLPMLAASSLRSYWSRLAAYEREFSALSAAMVVLLVYIVAAGLDPGLLPPASLAAALLLFNLTGYAVGRITGALTGGGSAAVTACVFTGGMREFGVATAVALSFFGTGAATAAALYGVIMMITGSAMIGVYGSQQRQ